LLILTHFLPHISAKNFIIDVLPDEVGPSNKIGKDELAIILVTSLIYFLNVEVIKKLVFYIGITFSFPTSILYP